MFKARFRERPEGQIALVNTQSYSPICQTSHYCFKNPPKRFPEGTLTQNLGLSKSKVLPYFPLQGTGGSLVKGHSFYFPEPQPCLRISTFVPCCAQVWLDIESLPQVHLKVPSMQYQWKWKGRGSSEFFVKNELQSPQIITLVPSTTGFSTVSLLRHISLA